MRAEVVQGKLDGLGLGDPYALRPRGSMGQRLRAQKALNLESRKQEGTEARRPESLEVQRVERPEARRTREYFEVSIMAYCTQVM